jgi:hypothetical protein
MQVTREESEYLNYSLLVAGSLQDYSSKVGFSNVFRV